MVSSFTRPYGMNPYVNAQPCGLRYVSLTPYFAIVSCTLVD